MSLSARTSIAYDTDGFTEDTTIMTARFWGDLKTTDFANVSADRTVAVLPLAAIEQHGPHLPVSVDTTIMNAMLAEAMPRGRAQAGDRDLAWRQQRSDEGGRA
jgi:hypothetical protein